MNTKIRSRTAFPRVLEETLYQAYQEGKRLVCLQPWKTSWSQL